MVERLDRHHFSGGGSDRRFRILRSNYRNYTVSFRECHLAEARLPRRKPSRFSVNRGDLPSLWASTRFVENSASASCTRPLLAVMLLVFERCGAPQPCPTTKETINP